MDLQGDDACVRNARLALDPNGGALAVEEEEDLRAARDDLVAVPVADLFEARDVVCVRLREHLVAARLVVERAGVARADVRLEAGHFIGRVWDALAAELHAAILEALRADERGFEAEVKVLVALQRGEELILGIPLQRPADDCAIAHAPDRVRLALPTSERLTIEQRHGRGGKFRDADAQENREKTERLDELHECGDSCASARRTQSRVTNPARSRPH